MANSGTDDGANSLLERSRKKAAALSATADGSVAVREGLTHG
jgi:hypothetical protein